MMSYHAFLLLLTACWLTNMAAGDVLDQPQYFRLHAWQPGNSVTNLSIGKYALVWDAPCALVGHPLHVMVADNLLDRFQYRGFAKPCGADTSALPAFLQARGGGRRPNTEIPYTTASNIVDLVSCWEKLYGIRVRYHPRLTNDYAALRLALDEADLRTVVSLERRVWSFLNNYSHCGKQARMTKSIAVAVICHDGIYLDSISARSLTALLIVAGCALPALAAIALSIIRRRQMTRMRIVLLLAVGVIACALLYEKCRWLLF